MPFLDHCMISKANRGGLRMGSSATRLLGLLLMMQHPIPIRWDIMLNALSKNTGLCPHKTSSEGGHIAHENKRKQDSSNYPKSLDSRTLANFPLISLAFLRAKQFDSSSRALLSFEGKSFLFDDHSGYLGKLPEGKRKRNRWAFSKGKHENSP